MSPASDLRDYLLAQGVCAAGTCFSGEMPPTPDDLTVLRDSPGFPPQYFLGVAAPGVLYPGVQVACRSVSKVGAETRAWAAWNSLAALAHVTINARRYEEARPLQTPFLLGGDLSNIQTGGDDGKFVAVFNVLAMRDA